MSEFLIDGKVLTDIADKIRETLNSEFSIDSESGTGLFEEGRVRVFYKEFVDYNSGEGYDGVDDGINHGDTFVAYGFLPNDEGVTVPVLYDTSLPDYEEPDYEEPWFYVGTAEVDGVFYDKWRKVETGGESPFFTWDCSSKQYVYTNIIVRKVTREIAPTDMPSKVDEVYQAGYRSGYRGAVTVVSELPPSENADKNTLYKCGDNYYKAAKVFEGLFVYKPNGSIAPYEEIYGQPKMTCSFYYVKSLPDSVPDLTVAGECRFFYEEISGQVYVQEYGNYELEVLQGFAGSVYSIDEITEPGIFALVADGWDKFLLTNGTMLIDDTGIFNVSGYEYVETYVPEGYLMPYGTNHITENGTHYVGTYKYAEVNVPPPEGSLVPEGKTTLTDNGIYDVSKFAEAEVLVPTVDASFTVEGKAIPINENVERIYFNINNSVEETDAILSKLTYIENVFDNPTAFVYGDTTDGYTGLFIGAWKFDDTHYAIGFFNNLESMSGVIIYATPGFVGDDESRYNGWLKEGYGPFDFTIDSMGVYGSSIPEFLGFPIGAENELVKNVLSVVPFAAPANNVATEGTPIPRGEVVEKIYFNTNNTAEETLAILSQLTYIQTPLVPYPINVIYGNTADGVTGSVIYAIKYSDTEIAIQELQNINSQNFLVLFNSDSTTLRGAGFNGWNFATVLGFNPGSARRNEELGIHSMNVYAGGQALTDFNGIPIGVENEKLKNVLSITPFAVASSKEDLEGTAIISGEAVEKVYFNINNTMEETNEILSQLTYVQTPFLRYPIYPIFAYVDPNGNGYTGKFIFAVKAGYHYEINYCEDIANQNFVYLYATQFSDTYEGWSYCNTIGDIAAEGVPAFIELNVAGSSEWGGLTVGAENDKIKNVLSLTPFAVKGDDRYDEGVEAGKQAEYDAFWDTYQDGGNRTSYQHGFAGFGWNDATFKPKYDIKPTDSFHLFSGTGITDLVKLLNDRNITLDLSKSVSASYLVQSSNTLQTLPVLNLTSRSHINYLLYDCAALQSVEKVILKEDGSQAFNAYSFKQLSALEEIRFEGTIGKSLEIKDSPLLSTASVQSIIDHLKDLTGATQQTLTLHADVGNNMTAEQKAAITSKNWQLVY